MRASVALTTVALLAFPARASAQYFGQNHVQYRSLDFAIVGTEHFDVYYYEEEREAAVDAARMAERGYQRLSRILNHRYRERQPLILYASHSEFQQNNVTPVDDATGGVTEPYRHRILLPFTGSYADFERVLLHEIVHQFQFDVFAGGNVGGGITQLMAVSPPLWFMEGMAEYLSIGPIGPQTAMWLRDAAIEGHLPDLDALNWDPRASPYRFGHALWAYIGERWGKAVVGDILHSTASAGVEGAFRRALGKSVSQVIDDWHAAIRRTYLPQATSHWYAFQFTEPTLTRERSTGGLHVAPAISPDGTSVAYLSEGGSFFIDLYVADVWTGRIEDRLIKSAFSSDFESLRFVNSAGSWSPDGRWFAIAAKNGPRDDIVIFDMDERRVNARLKVHLNGVTNPSWSPDGTHLVFTGHDGGFSDLFVIKADGSALRRLTQDPYADLHPVWSPDGTTIAFATDRGPHTNLRELEMNGMNIATITIADRHIEILPGMVENNINPQWAPDGQSLAFVSDRTGITNIFLYEFADRRIYQLTDVFTGVAGLTPLSPAISWAPLADRLLFTYYEHGSFNVYRIDDPRALKEQPWGPSSPKATNTLIAAAVREAPALDPPTTTLRMNPGGAVFDHGVHTLSRSTQLLRLQMLEAKPARRKPTISVRALLDSTSAALPDAATFSHTDYKPKLKPDFIGATSFGYVRDNFGSGFYGGSSISLSDMLANHRVMAAVAINGRVEEARIFAAYANMSHRTNVTAGISMGPYFSYSGSQFTSNGQGNSAFSATMERFIFREAFVRAHRPFNRFSRVEIGVKAVNLSHATLNVIQVFDPVTQLYRFESRALPLGNYSYLQPTIALVFDNAVSMYTGPMFGRRSRLEYSPAFGEWQFHEVLADLRRYDRLSGPFTLATRVFFFGRFGRDTDQFPLYLGNTDLLRGYTAGSIHGNECQVDNPENYTGCATLDQLIGSRLALFNAEVRFPLFRQLALGFAPINLPPLEGAVFFDAGMAWTSQSQLVVNREVGADESRFRHPLTSVGVSIRANMWGLMVLRADYTKPLRRAYRSAYVTISIGPAF